MFRAKGDSRCCWVTRRWLCKKTPSCGEVCVLYVQIYKLWHICSKRSSLVIVMTTISEIGDTFQTWVCNSQEDRCQYKCHVIHACGYEVVNYDFMCMGVGHRISFIRGWWGGMQLHTGSFQNGDTMVHDVGEQYEPKIYAYYIVISCSRVWGVCQTIIKRRQGMQLFALRLIC